MSKDYLEQKVEALIFASLTGVDSEEILQVFNSLYPELSLNTMQIEAIIEGIKQRYINSSTSSFSLKFINNKYQFLTKEEFYPLINQLQSQRSKRKLSQAALETLSIIAYRHPITKLEIEQIRGVNCDYTIQRLLEKDLINIIGKSNNLGRPLLYGLSDYFLDYFGINSKTDLPKLKDILTIENTIGGQGE